MPATPRTCEYCGVGEIDWIGYCDTCTACTACGGAWSNCSCAGFVHVEPPGLTQLTVINSPEERGNEMPQPERPDPLWCMRCGSRVADVDIAHYCEDHMSWSCDVCGTCESRDRHYDNDVDENGVHAWNYRPNHFKPKGNYPAEALLGVELEVGGRAAITSEVVRVVDPEFSHLYLKHDGSIDGVEIVTHPMTLAWARQFPFGELLLALRRRRRRVDESFGLHVHVSRNAFRCKGKQSRTHQMMWLLFMHRNQNELKQLARRVNNQYAAFRTPQPGELRRKACGVRWGEDSRYVAVNCNNDRTFELRFFQATLDFQQFMGALEFADASVRYTQDLDARQVLRGRGLSWRHFCEWVNRRNYKNLAAEVANIPQWKPPPPPQPYVPRPRRHQHNAQGLQFQWASDHTVNVWASDGSTVDSDRVVTAAELRRLWGILLPESTADYGVI